MGKIGADAVPALIETLQAKDTSLRTYAARAVGKMGPAGQSAIPALLKALQDQEVTVRREAAHALAAINSQVPAYGPPPPIGLPPFPPRLSLVEPEQRKELVSTLIAALKDSDGEVVQAVVQALGKIGATLSPL